MFKKRGFKKRGFKKRGFKKRGGRLNRVNSRYKFGRAGIRM